MQMDLTHTLRSDIAGRAGKAGLARKAILVLWAGLLSNLALTATTANAITENKEAYKLYAYVKLMDSKEFICLNALWTKESNWSSVAKNKKSSAMGIPQLLNMKEKDPFRQIDLGIAYAKKRYGTMCNSWAFFKLNGYY